MSTAEHSSKPRPKFPQATAHRDLAHPSFFNKHTVIYSSVWHTIPNYPIYYSSYFMYQWPLPLIEVEVPKELCKPKP